MIIVILDDDNIVKEEDDDEFFVEVGPLTGVEDAEEEPTENVNVDMLVPNIIVEGLLVIIFWHLALSNVIDDGVVDTAADKRVDEESSRLSSHKVIPPKPLRSTYHDLAVAPF